jgi:hypothetical protein
MTSSNLSPPSLSHWPITTITATLTYHHHHFHRHTNPSLPHYVIRTHTNRSRHFIITINTTLTFHHNHFYTNPSPLFPRHSPITTITATITYHHHHNHANPLCSVILSLPTYLTNQSSNVTTSLIYRNHHHPPRHYNLTPIHFHRFSKLSSPTPSWYSILHHHRKTNINHIIPS